MPVYDFWRRFRGRVRTGVARAHVFQGSTTFRCWMDSPQKPDQMVSVYTDGTRIY